jgi:hypothetical protein
MQAKEFISGTVKMRYGFCFIVSNYNVIHIQEDLKFQGYGKSNLLLFMLIIMHLLNYDNHSSQHTILKVY